MKKLVVGLVAAYTVGLLLIFAGLALYGFSEGTSEVAINLITVGGPVFFFTALTLGIIDCCLG